AELEPRFDYYALGHLHRGRILQVRKGSHAIAAYPGHLFSYWDGDGKSWPVHIVEGSIVADGTVAARLLSLSEACGAPETRRMYIDHADAGRAAGTIVFENAPPSDFFVEAGVETAKADDE